MKRLTEYEIIAGHVHVVPTDDADKAMADKAMMSLSAYEDTGLEPEAVRRLMQDWTSLVMTLDELGGMPHLRELVQAEQDGRLVVLADSIYFCGGKDQSARASEGNSDEGSLPEGKSAEFEEMTTMTASCHFERELWSD